jgi:hypothetical protein
MNVVIAARTAAGSRIEYALPAPLTLADVEIARSVVEVEHRKLGHHLEPTTGTPRTDQFFAGFTRSCVPQSEARALLERAGPGRVPEAVLRVLGRQGMDSMMLLYALTLERARSRARPRGGVWIGEE